MTRRRLTQLVSAIALAAALALATRSAGQADRVDRISAELRCPVCQGLSVRDSPSETAREMRDLVAQRVREGRSDGEIRDEFRTSYGDWVLLAPPAEGWTALVWIAPAALVAGGSLVALGAARRRRTAATASPSAAQLATLRSRLVESDEA